VVSAYDKTVRRKEHEIVRGRDFFDFAIYMCQGPVGIYTTGTGGWCSQRGRKRSGTVRRVYEVLPNDSRHSAVKRMRYSVGVDSIGKVANNPPKVGRAIDYVAAAPQPPLGSPGSGQLLYEQLTH
jgi:hypothetical protein